MIGAIGFALSQNDFGKESIHVVHEIFIKKCLF